MDRRFFNKGSTQSYLKPTLTTSFRPVSAPTFERYVEGYDLRYNADGYPVRHDLGMANSTLRNPILRQISKSEASSPKKGLYRPTELMCKVIEVQTKTQKDKVVVFNDDVQL